MIRIIFPLVQIFISPGFCHRKQQQRNAFFLAVIPNFGRYADFRMFDVENGLILQKHFVKTC